VGGEASIEHIVGVSPISSRHRKLLDLCIICFLPPRCDDRSTFVVVVEVVVVVV